MSIDWRGSSSRLDQFLNDVTWLNEDYPEANLALLEGLRNGLTGYHTDKIIKSRAESKVNCNQTSSSNGGGLSAVETKSENSDLRHYETMEQILEETNSHSPLPRNANASPTGPLKRNSALTVRPKSIGEERKAWILEAQRAYCLNDLQNGRFMNSVSEYFYRNSLANEMNKGSSYMKSERTSVSCPDLEARGEPVHQCELEHTSPPFSKEIHDHDSSESAESIEEKDSCEFLFHHVEGCFKPSKIRLSPRIEKLDKLIPKTSKEFLNTMRIVSTISPQPSEEQLNSLQGMHSDEDETKANCNDANHPTTTDDSDDMEENHIEIDHHSCSDADASGSRLSGIVCRSYKEVCIYGPPSSSGANSASLPSDQVSEKVLNDNNRNHTQSTSGFPSLPKLVKSGSGVGGDDGQKVAPPLYSSILQRSPTSTYGCGDANCNENHQHALNLQTTKSKGKTSPISAPSSPPTLGSFDCGFCRTNNEPEKVYRSHPLRINDIVVCPSLRKYVCCFCGATGDKAHTIKYCPKNPIGFFAKKARNSPIPPLMGEKLVTKPTCAECAPQQVQLSPVKCKEKDNKNGSINKEQIIQTEQESKSDSESVKAVDDSLIEPVKRTSGNWIEAKTKGRKKKNGK